MPAIQPFTWGGSGSDAVWGIAELPFVPQATGGGSTAVAPRIVWRSDGTGDAVTWADVMALIGVQPAVEIYVDQPGHVFTIPAGVYNMRHAVVRCGTIAAPVGLSLADGAELFDFGGVTGLVVLETNCTTAPAFTFTPGAVELLMGGFSLAAPTFRNAGSVPAIEVDGTTVPFILSMSGIARVELPGAGTRFFNLTGGLLIAALSEGIGQAQFEIDTVSGDAASAFAIAHDGTADTTWPTFFGFAGTFANAAKGVAGGSGPTAMRPQGFLGPIPFGCLYYDQDTSEELYWNGSTWIALASAPARAFGVAVPFGVIGVGGGLLVGPILVPGAVVGQQVAVQGNFGALPFGVFVQPVGVVAPGQVQLFVHSMGGSPGGVAIVDITTF